MKEIGGYFELEIGSYKEDDPEVVKINNARNSLEIIITTNNIQKIYFPYYTCEVMLEPIIRNRVDIEYYNIDQNFYPVFEFRELEEDSLFLYTNYFGICESNVNRILQEQKKFKFQLAIDNAQAFYSKVPNYERVYGFNSVRKFFGVPDGSFLYGMKSSRFINELEFEDSTRLVSHLVGRINKNANEYYSEFSTNDAIHSNLNVAKMSKITSIILGNLDFKEIRDKRNSNFIFLNEHLSIINLLKLDTSNVNGPLSYPLLLSNGSELREYLINNKVYIPKYWNNKKIISNGRVEKEFKDNIVSLPIDQRYSSKEMTHVIKLIQEYFQNK